MLKEYKEALVKAKIPQKGRKLTIHGLRHAYNTRMREILQKAAMEGFWDDVSMTFGGTLKNADQILREFTGHRSASMTELYDHPDLRNKLDAYRIFRPVIDGYWSA